MALLTRFSTYGTILRYPGTALFSATGLLARLPISMASLGIVLLVSATSGSYGLAGAISAAYVVCIAGVGPMQARIADRLGQRRVLPIAAAINATSLGLLVVSIHSGLTVPFAPLCAALAGATAPLIGSYVRARWTHALRDRRAELHTAYALEAIVDEAVFMIGPVLVTFLATSLSPYVGVLTAAGCGLLGGLLLALQFRTQPPVTRHSKADGSRPPIGWRAIAPLVMVSVNLGVAFGSIDVIVVAIATQAGARGASGPMLATIAAGSLVAAAVTGTIRFHRSPQSRLRIASACLAAAIVPLFLTENLWLLGGLLFLTGLAISPTLVASVSVAQAAVPAVRVTEGIAWNSAGINGGVAAGGALAGLVIDHHGGHAGLVVTLAAGVLTASFAALLARIIARRERRERREHGEHGEHRVESDIK